MRERAETALAGHVGEGGEKHRDARGPGIEIESGRAELAVFAIQRGESDPGRAVAGTDRRGGQHVAQPDGLGDEVADLRCVRLCGKSGRLRQTRKHAAEHPLLEAQVGGAERGGVRHQVIDGRHGEAGRDTLSAARFDPCRVGLCGEQRDVAMREGAALGRAK